MNTGTRDLEEAWVQLVNFPRSRSLLPRVCWSCLMCEGPSRNSWQEQLEKAHLQQLKPLASQVTKVMLCSRFLVSSFHVQSGRIQYCQTSRLVAISWCRA